MRREDPKYDCSICDVWYQGEPETWGGHICTNCEEFHDLEGACLPAHDLTTCGLALYRQELFAAINKREGRA